MKKKIFDFFYNLSTSGIEPESNSVKFRLILLNTVLFVAAIVMSTTFFYRMSQPFNPVLLFIDASTAVAFWGSIIALRRKKTLINIVLFSSIIIIAFMLIFIFIERNNSLAIVWTYMIPIFVIFINGYKRGLFLCLIFYCFIACHIIFKAELWQACGWNRLSTIRFATTSTALTLILAGCEYIFSQFNKSLMLLSNTDALTSINNRRHLDFLLSKIIDVKKRYDYYLSLVIIDIDNFKTINDTFGHPVGDTVLQQLAHLLTAHLRNTDEVGRWGGEEFCLILPQTNQSEALTLLDRLRQTINTHDFGVGRPVTCSFGFVTVKENNFHKEQLITLADAALYEAKKTGKDKICVSPVPV